MKTSLYDKEATVVFQLTSDMKSFIKFVLGEKVLGAMDYFRYPELRHSWGGAFNGQAFRQKIFLELLNLVDLDAIVETGTYRGTTTEFIHKQADIPVFSVEQNPRYFGYSRIRLAGCKKVKLNYDDSRNFLRKLTENSSMVNKKLLFYLDAHWGADLPLSEELEIIFKIWTNAIVMIDDFRVPDDEGYGFDDYGQGKQLSLEYLAPIRYLNLTPFFPVELSSLETGAKRGSVVLVGDCDIISTLRLAKTLRYWKTDREIHSNHKSPL